MTVLEGLEAVRKRPGMYIGSTSIRGLHHLVYEVVDNSVDEALAGYASQIEVTLLDDGGVRVKDDGRGIPVDPQTKGPHKGKSTLEVVLTILHAGGKFGGDAYAVSGGLHGVGISVVNALSTRVEVEVRQQGHIWTQTFTGEKGLPEAPIKKGASIPEDETGTTVTFWADGTIFETTTYDFETLRNRFQQMAFLNKGLRITLTDARIANHHTKSITELSEEELPEGAEIENIETGNDDSNGTETATNEADAKEDAPKRDKAKGDNESKVTYYYERGLYDYVAHINKAKHADVLHSEIISFESEQKNPLISAELALQWTTAYSESIYTFANTISTTEGGTHEEGFRTALTSLMNKYAREKQLLKEKDDNLTGDDVREGLTCVISVKLGEPQFEGQTKTKLGNSEVRAFVIKVVNEKLVDWFDSHPNEAKIIVQKAQSAAHARIAARKAREATRRKSVFESASMPDKLKDCQSTDASECEIFIVEGDSAGGSAIQGRNPYNQAILPLRGKILNVEKARVDRALSSETIQSLITAIGTGWGQEFEAEKARYHKIVLMTDADVDGAHISTLILTFLFRYMQPLISLGYIYIAMPPLYRIKWSGKSHEFVFSDEERDKALAAGEAEGKKLPKEGLQRYKGLGEMNYNELWDTTMDPQTRTLKQITMEDAAVADEVFSLLMGEDVGSRRAFIQQNAKDVRFLDV
ncbi:MAG: DNA topoisomerase (ATP-hydrolyzing) subunit B [Candidatus Ancillula sp.]|nr:DNA topoisomerase (ATP-hydrolyzing) subunit B [Candidatus Ancillula sp.]